MGRPNHLKDLDPKGRVPMSRVYLNAEGYDAGGAHWGPGDPLWWALCPTTKAERFVRAPSYTQAVRLNQLMWPNATIIDGGTAQ